MPQGADIFDRREPWGGPLAASMVFHGAIFGLILAYSAWKGFSGNTWGDATSGSGSMSATLVSSAAIPLPSETVTPNIVANESKGVTKSQPKEVAPPEPKAIEIPRETKTPPKRVQRTTTEKKPEPMQQANNIVPFGEGGQVHQAYSTFNTSLGQGAIAITSGGGDFGSRYAYYVKQVTQILSQNWFKYEVDPHTGVNATVTVAFDIARNGQPTNVRIEQSSGIPSLDTSATRTLQRIDTFGPLPSDYRGGSVSAHYEFRYSPIKQR